MGARCGSAPTLRDSTCHRADDKSDDRAHNDGGDKVRGNDVREPLNGSATALSFANHTHDLSKKRFAANALRLHDVNPITAKCQFTRDELEQIRQTLPTGNETFGPRTASDLRAYVGHHHATA